MDRRADPLGLRNAGAHMSNFGGPFSECPEGGRTRGEPISATSQIQASAVCTKTDRARALAPPPLPACQAHAGLWARRPKRAHPLAAAVAVRPILAIRAGHHKRLASLQDLQGWCSYFSAVLCICLWISFGFYKRCGSALSGARSVAGSLQRNRTCSPGLPGRLHRDVSGGVDKMRTELAQLKPVSVQSKRVSATPTPGRV